MGSKMYVYARFFALTAAALVSGASLAQGAPAGGTPRDASVFRPAPSEAHSPSLTIAPGGSIGRDYRFRPNDLIEVEVFEMENLKRTVRINALGMVSLPLIGGVQVGGLTATQAEALIASRYSEKYLQNPNVSIFVKELNVDRITVEGAVVRPGVIPLTERMTLLRVLAQAGGFGPIANTSEVMIFRVNDKNVRQFAVFDVEDIRAGKTDDPVIMGDDLIVVQRDRTRALLKDSIFRDIVDSVNPFSFFAR